MLHKYVTLFVCLLFILRLAFTTQPPIGYEHTWRQSTGLMYARNFVETDANFFHPRIDDNAGGTGILVLEAPILYYGMYLLSQPFGYQDWYGRLINLIVSSLGLYFFFLLVRRFFTERVGFFATLILTTSLWLIFSRKTMQDTMAVSFLFMALHFCFNYFSRGGWKNLAGYVLLAALGLLAKLPAGMYLLFPLIYLLKYSVDKQRIINWGLITLVPVALSCLWYFGYAPYASEKYGYWHNVGESFPDGFRSLLGNVRKVFERFLFQSLHSFVFLVLFLWSWGWMIWNKRKGYLLLFGSFTLLFGLFMIRSGTYFVQHNYYMIPYIPVMAIMIALVLEKMPRKKWAIFLLVLGMAEGVAWQVRDFTNSPRQEYKMKLTEIADQFSASDDQIVLINNGNPIGFYFTHRKGWLQSEEETLDKAYLEDLTAQGARILIVNRHHRNHKYDLSLIYEDADYRVYQLGIDVKDDVVKNQTM